MTKVLITGDRQYRNRDHVRLVISRLIEQGVDTIVQGGAPGADSIADFMACSMGILSITVGAEWERQGRAAGPIRNRRVLLDHPDIAYVVYFHDTVFASKDTLDMCKQAAAKGLRVFNSRLVATSLIAK